MNDEATVFLVHGILSDGAWHRSVRKVLWPFFQTQSIRYREYHAFGPVNIFFWPWAIILAGILGWFATRAYVDAANYIFVIVPLVLVLVVALAATWRSGLARTVPWMAVGAFWLGATGEERSVLLAMAASVAVSVVGYYRTVQARRGIGYWLLAVLLTGVCWAAGWGATRFAAGWALVLPAVLLGLYIAYCEWNWNRWTWNGWIGTVLIPLSVVICAIAIAVKGFNDDRLLVLFAGVLVLMVFLEWREAFDNGWRDYGWLGEVVGIAALGAAGWYYMKEFAFVGYVVSAGLLAVGWREPVRRVDRAASRVVAAAGSATRWSRDHRSSWIAHSLGTYLTGVAFRVNNIRLERLLFVGGAIAEDYPWGPLVQGRPPVVRHLRNEHGTWDAVIRLLWSGGSWMTRRQLGGAGWVGLQFQPPPDIHHVANYRTTCPHCTAAALVSPVHNYRLDNFRHSTYFLEDPHARDEWLPYLWGHWPAEVRMFYQRCLDLRVARGRGRRVYANTLAEFLAEPYNWYLLSGGSRPFSAWIDDEVGQQSANLDGLYPGLRYPPSELVRRQAAVVSSDVVLMAIAARDRSPNTMSPNLIPWLDPGIAAQNAARIAFHMIGKRLRNGWRP